MFTFEGERWGRGEGKDERLLASSGADAAENGPSKIYPLGSREVSLPLNISHCVDGPPQSEGREYITDVTSCDHPDNAYWSRAISIDRKLPLKVSC